MNRLLPRLASLLCLATVVSGCAAAGPSAAPDPERGRAAWIEALSSGQPERVWALMDDEARAPFADATAFAAWCSTRCSDLLLVAMSANSEARASVYFGAGLQVRKVGGRLVVHDAAISAADTPLEAVRRLRSVGASALSVSTLRLLDAVIEAGAGAASVQGDRARIALSDGRAVTLRHGPSGWRVDGWTDPH